MVNFLQYLEFHMIDKKQFYWHLICETHAILSPVKRPSIGKWSKTLAWSLFIRFITEVS